MAKSIWQPKAADYQAALRDQNPWHALGKVPEELARPVQRPLAQVLWPVLLHRDERRHQLILGPRRVGKTTVLYQTVQRLIGEGIAPRRLWWLRLDHPLLIEWSLDDLVRQIVNASQADASRPVFLFMDELTYADKWDLWLKTFYDDRWPVRIVATSSATAAIRQRGTESGVGRWSEHFLAPYLFSEFLDLRKSPSAVRPRATLGETLCNLIESSERPISLSQSRRHFLLTGGFPELLINERETDEASEILRSQRILRSDAVEKAIYKDIPQAFSIQDPTKLERLLYILAGQVCGLLSPNSIAAALSMTAPTVDSYIEYLERAFIVFTLPGFAASEEKTQRRGKKVYFVDGAVRNAALLRGISPLNDQAEMGILTENLAASHLRVLAYHETVRLYHWRNKGDEVDLVYDHPHDPLAFELTISKSHSTRGLLAFQQQHPRFRERCYIVSESDEYTLPSDQQPGRIPIDAFLVAVGCQGQAALQHRMSFGTPPGSGGQTLLF